MLNQHIGKKPASYMRTDNVGMFSSFGPYVGIIKNNIDPTAAGRLQVFIPGKGAGADENDPSNWITVSYASPFRGQTRQRGDLNNYVDNGLDYTTTEGYQENSFQSYGFWFVPPDLNGRVLCVFANGDPSQGYWFACIQDSMDAHMVPAIGSVPASQTNEAGSGGYIWKPTGSDAIPTHTMLQDYIQITGNGEQEIPYRLPVSEPVLVDQSKSNPATPTAVQMVPHVWQTLQLGKQGLAFDFIRGSTSASSVRENPSQVFGISTPGRLSSFANVEISEALINKLKGFVNDSGANDTSDIEKALTCMYRTGGHQIVLDDGTVDGKDQGIRIRSSAGNEILLDDTNGQIYIINSTGNAWIEMSPSGYIDVFSNQDYSVRSKGNINFHADKDVLIHAGGDFKVHADGSLNLESGNTMTMYSNAGMTIYDDTSMQIGTDGSSKISSKSMEVDAGTKFSVQAGAINLPGVAGTVKKPSTIGSKNQIEVGQQDGSKAWWQKGAFKSITKRAMSHEPWPGHEINGIRTAKVNSTPDTSNPISRPSTGTTSSGVRGTIVGNGINESDLASQPLTGAVCGLTAAQTRAMLASLAKRESKFPKNTPGKGGANSYTLSNGGTGYFAINQLGYVGKYQCGAALLETMGFLKKGSSKNTTNAKAIGNDSNWTSFMGCSGAVAFINNPSAQEAIVMMEMKANCKTLKSWGVLSDKSLAEDIAGYLFVSHLLGCGGALTLFRSNNPGGQLYGAPSKSYNTSDANGTTANSYFASGANAVKLANSSSNA